MTMHKVMKSWTTKSGLEAVVLFVRDSYNCGYVELPEHLKKYNFTGYNGKKILLEKTRLRVQ